MQFVWYLIRTHISMSYIHSIIYFICVFLTHSHLCTTRYGRFHKSLLVSWEKIISVQSSIIVIFYLRNPRMTTLMLKLSRTVLIWKKTLVSNTLVGEGVYLTLSGYYNSLLHWEHWHIFFSRNYIYSNSDPVYTISGNIFFNNPKSFPDRSFFCLHAPWKLMIVDNNRHQFDCRACSGRLEL